MSYFAFSRSHAGGAISHAARDTLVEIESWARQQMMEQNKIEKVCIGYVTHEMVRACPPIVTRAVPFPKEVVPQGNGQKTEEPKQPWNAADAFGDIPNLAGR